MDESRSRFIIRNLLQQSEVEELYGRMYERGLEDIVDMLDIDKFSVHTMDGILEQLGYDARLMTVYVEHDQTTVHTYFCSPSKVIIEEITDEEIMTIPDVTTVKKRLCLGWINDEPDIGDDPNFDPFFGEKADMGGNGIKHHLNDQLNENCVANDQVNDMGGNDKEHDEDYLVPEDGIDGSESQGDSKSGDESESDNEFKLDDADIVNDYEEKEVEDDEKRN
ncbi:hypothetical protein M8C21_023192 [Ambrosia artemisiifolia]|uniref:Uncharacterized protein n=1 Tax=Ambrosia artemisiifolia TaxID=4212 RepID=A0AAD5GJY6_AMBAR|nr:hypothetical protein M8C21_023192 [Ambrosia artemisiifolia]